MINAGELDWKVPFGTLVENGFAENVE